MKSAWTSSLGFRAIAGKLFLLWGIASLPCHAQAPVWNATGPLLAKRLLHTATLLPDGKVLITGGLTACNPVCAPTPSVEIYDPATGSWRFASRMKLPRVNHAAVRLPDGKVLVAGGYIGYGGVTNESEIFDPSTETWS